MLKPAEGEANENWKTYFEYKMYFLEKCLNSGEDFSRMF